MDPPRNVKMNNDFELFAFPIEKEIGDAIG